MPPVELDRIETDMNEHIKPIVGVESDCVARRKHGLDLAVSGSDDLVARRHDGDALTEQAGGERLVLNLRERNHFARERRKQRLVSRTQANRLEKPVEHVPPRSPVQ